jgi:hypothetical protein
MKATTPVTEILAPGCRRPKSLFRKCLAPEAFRAEIVAADGREIESWDKGFFSRVLFPGVYCVSDC